jgi:hypothetical protein
MDVFSFGLGQAVLFRHASLGYDKIKAEGCISVVRIPPGCPLIPSLISHSVPAGKGMCMKLVEASGIFLALAALLRFSVT